MTFVWPTSHVGMLHPLAAKGTHARAQGLWFLQMAEAAANGRTYDQAKASFKDVDQATVETRKSLYEELGLLYVPQQSGTLHLTGVGQQLFELLGTNPPINSSEELLRQVNSLLCWAMGHSQINRPQSLGSPAITRRERSECDIRPYATFWLALFRLGGTITFDEFSSVMAHLQRADDFADAIDTILFARKSRILPESPAKTENFGIYWKAHLSVASLVLNVSDQQFSFAKGGDVVLKSVLDFQIGCADDDGGALIRAKPWANVEEYYDFAGQSCPPFIASGQATVVKHEGQHIVLLKGYELQRDTEGYFVDTGIEMCPLKMGMPCFHSSEPNRMLRVDRKVSSSLHGIRIRLGLGRPINDPSRFLQLWGET